LRDGRTLAAIRHMVFRKRQGPQILLDGGDLYDVVKMQ